MDNLVIGIDVGTHKVCTVVAQVRPDSVFVIGAGVEGTRGMKAGLVTDLEALTKSISGSVYKAEQTSGYVIKRAFVSISGAHVHSDNSRGAVGISGPRGVTPDDVERAMENARAIAIPHSREILHVVPRHYVLDGQSRVRQPVGMFGFRLEVEANIVTAATPSVNNIEQAVEGAGVLVDRFIVSPLASGDAVLTDEEREAGVVLIDLGAGTTDLAIFIEGAVWHTAVVGIAGDLISSDISHWLQVSTELAELVKLQRGHCVPKRVSELETFLVEPFGEGLPIETKRRELAEVIEARTEEIFEKCRDEIKRSGYDGLLRAGAVLTGGTSQLPGIEELAKQMLGIPIRLARPERLTGLGDMLKAPAYSTSIGLLRLGLQLDAVQAAATSAPTPAPNGKWGERVRGLLKRLLPDAEE
ncbi:MAG: cell division protein FtsA [Chloroflexi bacterium]|nr:cell division protein FtsA [Chloroflexota bacterium]